jgi:putative FmdB family regulatory protein
MPTYQYICDYCKYEFEKYQSIKADPLKKCPQCHKDTLRKVISGGVGLIFKGSGFYITDYKKQQSSPAKSKSSSVKTETKESNPKKDTKDK